MQYMAKLALCYIFILAMIWDVQSQSLAVENVRFKQDASSNVIVNFDLLGKESQKYIVILSIFIPSSRKKVPISTKNLTGAVGKSVIPGKNLEIVWDLKQEFPNGLEGEGFRFIIDAYIQQKSINRWPWIVAGIAAAGGAAVLLTSSSSATSPGEQDLPSPPILPPNQ